MSIKKCFRNAPAAIAAGFLILALSAPAAGEDMGDREDFKAEGWPIPDWKNSTRQGRKWLNLTPLIEGTETKAVGFVGREIPAFVTWSIDEDMFAVVIDEDGRAPFDYSLWDRNGDGRFEMKTGAYRNIRAPYWAVERYFTRRGLEPPPADSAGPPRPVPPSEPGDEAAAGAKDETAAGSADDSDP